MILHGTPLCPGPSPGVVKREMLVEGAGVPRKLEAAHKRTLTLAAAIQTYAAPCDSPDDYDETSGSCAACEKRDRRAALRTLPNSVEPGQERQ